MSARTDLLERYRAREFDLARETLSDFMLDAAYLTGEVVGFRWVLTDDAPQRYEQLVGAYHRSVSTGIPLPISSAHNDQTMYTTPAANIAFRFVHDVHHVRHQLTFDLLDELDLAVWHLGKLEQAGFDATSLPWRMLQADLVGQIHVSALAKRFPFDQQRFVRRCVTDGLERGLVREARLKAVDEADTDG